VSATCPDGHTSTATDFCDVCGAPIAGSPTVIPTGSAPPATGPVSTVAPPPEAGSPPAPSTAASTGSAAPGPGGSASGATGATTVCPGCGTVVSADALFCEGCGRDMVTGQMPGPSAAPGPGGDAAASIPKTRTGWVAEVWVDEEWFAARGEGRCPTVGEPRTAPVGDGSLIGRVSKSRNIAPDVDCSADGSVSARQATLGFDGVRWTITDLGSTNGTFVAHPGGPLPTDPIEPNTPIELEAGDRILIGAHTRVVIRAETTAEAAAGSAG
jgi:hypothetical protein